jgi:5-methylcytosine-specific restriction endonuclease McrA
MSLGKVGSARIERSGFWIFGSWKFFVTKTRCFALGRSEYRAARRRLEASGVALIGREGDRHLWWSDEGLFWSDAGLAAEDVELLIWDRQRRQGSRLDRLRKIRAREEDADRARRERIPDEVRAFVWERDDGRCVRCGAEDELQFDHVIPVAKGGGNAIDNVQVLCADCNRQKSDSIV